MFRSLHGIMAIFCFLFLLGATQGKSVGAEKEEKQQNKVVRKDNALIDDIKKRGKLIVAQVSVIQPPFFWPEQKDGKEVWSGYEIDLAKKIADKLGVDMEILRLGEDYNEVCRVVEQGRADIGISNLSDTEARREFVDFTQPYIVSRVAMLVDIDGLDKDGIEAIEPKDLNDPKVKIALTADSNYDFVYLELAPKAKRVQAQQGEFDAVAKPVIAGEAHAVIDDGLVLHMGMMEHPEYSPRLYLHVFDEYDDPLSICLPHNQQPLKDLINGIIQEIEAVEPVTLEYLIEQYMR